MTAGTQHLIEVIIAAIVSITGTLASRKVIDKTAKKKPLPPMDESTKQLIIELRRQLTEVKKDAQQTKRDLERERRERIADGVRHQRELDTTNRKLAEAHLTIALLQQKYGVTDAVQQDDATDEGDVA